MRRANFWTWEAQTLQPAWLHTAGAGQRRDVGIERRRLNARGRAFGARNHGRAFVLSIWDSDGAGGPSINGGPTDPCDWADPEIQGAPPVTKLIMIRQLDFCAGQAERA